MKYGYFQCWFRYFSNTKFLKDTDIIKFNKKDFSKFETPMCARNEDSNKIEWEDLPDSNSQIRKKLQAYIKFICIYNNLIYELLQEDREIPIAKGLMGLFSKKRHSWEIELLQKAGNVDIANNEAWKDFVVMKEYAETFLSWLENIVSNPKIIGIQDVTEFCYKVRIVCQTLPFEYFEISMFLL